MTDYTAEREKNLEGITLDEMIKSVRAIDEEKSMKLEIYQKIRLHNGKVGHVIEIFNDGEAYMIDVKLGDGEYEQETVRPQEIKSIIVEVEKPFVAA